MNIVTPTLVVRKAGISGVLNVTVEGTYKIVLKIYDDKGLIMLITSIIRASRDMQVPLNVIGYLLQSINGNIKVYAEIYYNGKLVSIVPISE